MEGFSTVLKETIYTMYKGRERGNFDVVELHRGLTASPEGSLDGDLIPQGSNSLHNMIHTG